MPNAKRPAARRARAPRRHTAATAAEPETTAVERLIAHCEEVVRAFTATLEGSTAKSRRDAGILSELAEIRQRLLKPLRRENLRSDAAAECETWPNRDRVAEVIEQAIEGLDRLASDDIRVYPMERDADGAPQVRLTVDEYVSTREDWLEEKHGLLLPAIDSLRGLARPPVPVETVKEAAAALAPGDAKPVVHHSDDFTSVVWYGAEYYFSRMQADSVKALWAQWKKSPGLGLHAGTILESLDSSCERDRFRLPLTFRDHPAWGTMIVPVGRGTFKLAAPPEKAARSRKRPHRRINPESTQKRH